MEAPLRVSREAPLRVSREAPLQMSREPHEHDQRCKESHVAASGTQAIDRAAELLSLVVLADEPPAFGDLVSDTGLAKSTASRLLQALERHRLVHRIDDGGYEAGPLFALYASRHEPAEELIHLAQSTLEAISEATGETVNLAVVRGNAVVQIAQINSRFLLATTNWVDVDVPPHCSALGKVFFADGVIPVPRGVMVSRTEHTITDPTVLERQLKAVRRDGYAQAFGELEIGLDAIATPVYDRTGRAIAAIGISGPSDRIHHRLRQLGELLQSHAQELSAVLGHRSRKEGAA
jgi:DNA-binding IclR family transcriptional regulator